MLRSNCIPSIYVKSTFFADCIDLLFLDAETAKLSKVWNHSNVLVLSNRTLREDSADAILAAWFDEEYEREVGKGGVDELAALESDRMK